MNVSLLDKYRPESKDDLVGQRKNISSIVRFLKKFPAVKKNALLLYGPPGVGKTCSVKSIANSIDYKVFEIDNFSELSDDLVKSGSIFGKSKVLLIDPLEAFKSKSSKIKDLIKSTKVPIVIIAMDPWDDGLRKVRNLCRLIEFKPLNESYIEKYLKKVSKQEGMGLSDELIAKIAENSEGDLRAALMDLEVVAQGKSAGSQILEERFKEKGIFKGIKSIYRAENVGEALGAAEKIDMNLDTLLLWLAENLPNEFSKGEELSQAYDWASKSDTFIGRARSLREWRFFYYANFLATVGIYSSRSKERKGFKRYQRPPKIKKMGKIKKDRYLLNSIAGKIGEVVHSSSGKIKKEYVPFLKGLAERDAQLFKSLSKYFNLTEKEVSLLK